MVVCFWQLSTRLWYFQCIGIGYCVLIINLMTANAVVLYRKTLLSVKVDQVLCHHMGSLGHNELIVTIFIFTAELKLVFMPLNSLVFTRDIIFGTRVTTFEISYGRGRDGLPGGALACSTDSEVIIHNEGSLSSKYGLTVTGYVTVTGPGDIFSFVLEANRTVSLKAKEGNSLELSVT